MQRGGQRWFQKSVGNVAGRWPESDKDNELSSGSPEDDNKRAEHAIDNCQIHCSVRLAQAEKGASASCHQQLSQKLTCNAGRSLVGVQHNLLAQLRVSWRCVSPSFASRIFEVEPLSVVPGFVSGSQPDSRWDDINGTMAQDEPLGL